MSFRPSELFPFLEELGIRPKKSLSQNFLIDGNIVRKIIETAEIQPGDRVIEIGPGPGALTEALLARGAQVTAIEKDTTFAGQLRRFQTPANHLEVYEADALHFPFEERPHPPYKVVANLPYHIGTALLIRLLPLYPHFSTLTIMLQKEVGERLTAQPKTAEYGSLTLYAQFFSEVKRCFLIKPTCFYPKPKVESVVVQCRLHSPSKVSSMTRFFTLTRRAFNQRRKMLKASLKELYPKEAIEEVLLSLNLPLTTRPEELSLGDFMALFESLEQKCPESK